MSVAPGEAGAAWIPTPTQLFAKSCRIHAEHVAGMGDGRLEDDEYPVGGVPRGLLHRERPPDPGAAYWCRKYVRDWKRRRRAWPRSVPTRPRTQPAPGAPEMFRPVPAPNCEIMPSPEEQPAQPKSGHKGIYWHKGSNRWQVQVSIGGKVKSFGLYDDLTDAIAARDAATANDQGVAPDPAPASPSPPIAVPLPQAPSQSLDQALDPEVEAIGSIAKALSGLDAEASRRVIDWAIARYTGRRKDGQP